jgi:predicted RNA-binding Zn-ribbon protein involved in translation (DUF1610 family)
MSEVIKKEKIRKVFLDDLPRWGKKGMGNEGTINWSEINNNIVEFIYDDIIGEIEILKYDSITRYLYLRYLNNPIFKMKTSDFQNCKLKGLLGLKTSEFKIEIGTVFKDSKRDIIITDRRINNTTRSKEYKYKCDKCGFECGEHYKNANYKEELWTPESNLLTQKQGCACCNNKVVAEGINDIPTTTPFMTKYFENGYEDAKKFTFNSGKKIHFKCPDCGRIKTKLLL